MVKLKIFGNVKNVLNGNITEAVLRPAKESRLRFALGAGTFSDGQHLGETLVIEQNCHVSWVQKSHLQNGSGLNAKTPFLMGIDRDEPMGLLNSLNRETALESLYGEWAKKHPMGFALLGSFRMKEWSCTYLKKPPIFQENINQHHDAYWAKVENHSNAFICLFGVVIPPTAEKNFPKSTLEKAFYKNPQDSSQAPFQSHTHAAFADRLLKSDSFLFRDFKIGSVRHTLTQSILHEGSFVLFPLQGIESN
ncbi:MAG: hypothetical protein K1X28_07450 [Parachlamydiales bacterium]|nr:hypothetical protein [Parachlamydiales bacterium]